jgi:hypothetical protein
MIKMSCLSSAASFETNEDHHEEETLQEAAEQDVLFGRGGKSYSHPGNRLFRRLIFHHKDLYESMKKPNHRQFLALSIVEAMKRAGARFLRKESTSHGEVWKTVSAKEAVIKTSQALRDANVRTKRCSKGNRNDGSNKANVILNDEYDEGQRDRNVVSPCNSSPNSSTYESVAHSAPPITMAPTITAPHEEKFEDIDHIDLETIHTLVRSLGAARPQPLQESHSHSVPARPSIQRSGSTRWSLSRPPQQHSGFPSRSSLLAREWLAKEAACDKALPPASLKPSIPTFRHDLHSSASRCSITSVSMLEAGLFSADFDFDDFEIDTDSFAV